MSEIILLVFAENASFLLTNSCSQIRNADPYKGPYGGKACRDSVVQADRSCDCQPGQCMASEQYLEEVTDALTYCAPKDKIGAFFAESIQVRTYLLK